MNWQRFIRKCKAGFYIIRAKAQPSFSQVGEDLIVHYLLQQIGIQRPSYLDIGTNFPVAGNNTYFFYNRGFRGVCIEPDPALFAMIRKSRPRDTVLHAGVAVSPQKEATLHVFPHPYTGWNTFSETEALRRTQESGILPRARISVPLLSINDVIASNFKSCPHFLSIDVEGLDLEILQSLDFTRFRPEVICIESITFSTQHQEAKIPEIEEFMRAHGYFAYADTHVNTIFCRRDQIKNQGT